MNFINIKYNKIENINKGKVKYKVENKELFAEETAIYHYNQNGYNAIWSENEYWWEILGLLFWDVIFARVTGAVLVSVRGISEVLYAGSDQFNQYFDSTIKMNGMPADFFSIDFYKNRESLIKNRIKELTNADLSIVIEESYKNNYGKNFRMIESWDKFSIDQLLISVEKIDNIILLKILERILKNISENRSGLPDLIVYNSSKFFMAEVKSEKDKLSDNQSDWHSFLNTLGIKVQLCLINHTDRQISNMLKKEENKKIIDISFGYSNSKKREEAIAFIKNQSTFYTEGEGKNQVYSAEFDVNNIENLYTMLDLTSGWKSQKIEIDGKIIKSTELRNGLWCFRKKCELGESTDYCKKAKYENKKNPFDCNMVCFDTESYTQYGYVNTDTGEWIFNNDEIENYKKEVIEKLKYCPLFDEKKVERVFNKIPKTINPKVEEQWAYISNNYDYWYHNKSYWIGSFGNKNFPGISSMIGIKKLDKKEINRIIKNAELHENYSTLSRTQSKQEKSGCFIATAVYQNYNAPEVQVLRKFRDKKLNRCVLGKAFIKVYYFMSPPIANLLSGHKIISKYIKYLLDKIVKNINI